MKRELPTPPKTDRRLLGVGSSRCMLRGEPICTTDGRLAMENRARYIQQSKATTGGKVPRA